MVFRFEFQDVPNSFSLFRKIPRLFLNSTALMKFLVNSRFPRFSRPTYFSGLQALSLFNSDPNSEILRQNHTN